MRVAKWGNSLAIRLPKKLVDELGLKEGDEVKLMRQVNDKIAVSRDNAREEALKRLLATNWPLPPGYKFDREEAHERGWRLDESQVRPKRRRA
ncbi:MAG TPA: AbrB/MazE/SpoVT family DNA-binding domain-containing protein [Rhizomicrobium sp.]|jgi:antitoxin MazE|nr:AbrB/MazE/SpoVT family DNA-binding domain-containing protein [Rhizomicrobium sp.]